MSSRAWWRGEEWLLNKNNNTIWEFWNFVLKFSDEWARLNWTLMSSNWNSDRWYRVKEARRELLTRRNFFWRVLGLFAFALARDIFIHDLETRGRQLTDDDECESSIEFTWNSALVAMMKINCSIEWKRSLCKIWISISFNFQVLLSTAPLRSSSNLTETLSEKDHHHLPFSRRQWMYLVNWMEIS